MSRADSAPSVPQFLASLASGFVDVLRNNKLAATLSAVALVATTVLALSSQYDERPRYRQVLLPDIEQAEARFLDTMTYAEKASNENWRLYYFINAHQRARDALKQIRMRKPHTGEGLRAHDELIRFYESVNEELAIIRTEMSIDDDLDYMGAWKKKRAEIWPIHERWANWVKGGT